LIGVLMYTDNPNTEINTRDVQAAARAVGQQILTGTVADQAAGIRVLAAAIDRGNAVRSGGQEHADAPCALLRAPLVATPLPRHRAA
jgi:hypothetical protein